MWSKLFAETERTFCEYFSVGMQYKITSFLVFFLQNMSTFAAQSLFRICRIVPNSWSCTSAEGLRGRLPTKGDDEIWRTPRKFNIWKVRLLWLRSMWCNFHSVYKTLREPFTRKSRFLWISADDFWFHTSFCPLGETVSHMLSRSTSSVGVDGGFVLTVCSF